MPHVVDKYRPIAAPAGRRASPARVLSACWAVMLGVALWSAPSLHASLESSGSSAAPAAERLERLAEGVRLPELRDTLEAGLTQASRWGRFGEPPPPPPASTPTPAPPVGPEEDLIWSGIEAPATRVLVVGASTINSYLGSELRRRLEETYGVVAIRDGRLGTGLVRSDVFDWPAHLEALVREHKPDLVIANFGGNDAQPIAVPSGGKVAFGREGWDEEYARRVQGMVRATEAAGAEVVWIGMGVVKEPAFSERLRRLDRILEHAVEEAGGVYVEQSDLTANKEGGYRVEVTVAGKSGLMHMSDGVHLTRLGAQSVVSGLLPRLERAASLRPVAEELAIASRVPLRSTVRQEDTPSLVMVPREVPGGGLPLIYLLHGAWDDWTIWSEKAHRELQALATRHGVILAMTDGRRFGWYLDSPRVPTNQIATWFVEEQRPAIESVVPHSGAIGLLGISMGGHGAMSFALDEPEAYGAVSVLSGAVDLPFAKSRTQLQDLLGRYEEAPEQWESRSVVHRVASRDRPLPPIRLVCGTEDIWFPSNQALASALGEDAEVAWIAGEAHTWELWLSQLEPQIRWQAEQLRR